MGTEAPTPIVIPVYCAYKKAPCPRCGNRGRRKRVLTRTVRTVAFLEITYAEYAAGCHGSTTFRNSPEGVPLKAKYDDRVRGPVLDRLLKDGMSIERALESIRGKFLLDLSTGFVHDVLRDRAAELDMAEHRREVPKHFSGTLCVDEPHLGRSTPLPATNHVERTNRMFRFLEKVRYKWRRRRTLVRFVVLKLDEVWSGWKPASVEGHEARSPVKRRESPPEENRRARRIA